MLSPSNSTTTTLIKTINSTLINSTTAHQTQPIVMVVPCWFPSATKTLLCLVLLTILSLSLIVNFGLIHAVYTRPRLQKLSMVLLVSLSISDLFTSLTVPFFEFVLIAFYPYWPFGLYGEYIFNPVRAFSLVAPFATGTAIILEKYIAINRHNLYVRFHTPFTVASVVACVWLYSLIWVVLIYLHLKPSRDIDRYLWNVDHGLYYTLIGINVGLPMFIIPVLYYFICRHVKRSNKCFFSTASSTTSLICNVMREREIKLTQTALIAIAALYAVWLPVIIIEINFTSYNSICTVKKIDLVSVSLTSFNCFLNPVLYLYKNGDIRKYLHEQRKLFC